MNIKIIMLYNDFTCIQPSFHTEMPTILKRKLSQKRKNTDCIALFSKIISRVGKVLASNKPENGKIEKW